MAVFLVDGFTETTSASIFWPIFRSVEYPSFTFSTTSAQVPEVLVEAA